ncbi:hypothetical protein ALQ18_05157 [Pseudomonas marginalis pv. marginalis]|nr:hypothetical protein ALQ18_05157 [Pseudomonas marginalis pv. marginalis]
MDVEKSYFLGTITLDNDTRLEIKKSEYLELLKSKVTLTTALNIEEKYDVALSNYLEFEKEQLTLTLDNLVNSIHYDYHQSYKVLSTLNRRLVNFLSTAKQYTELVAGLSAKCTTNESETKSIITALLRKQYDDHLDYRMMESLRNHVNHYGLAVHTISTPSKWTLTEQQKTDKLVFNLEIYAEKSALAENSSFKRKVLNELPEKFDLKKGARSYMGSISRVHEEFRQLTSESVGSARETIETYLNSYGRLNDETSFAVGAFREEKGKPTESPIMLDLHWDDVRLGLLKRNVSITNMNRRHISSALVTK